MSGARLVGVARATLGGFGAVPGTRGRTILAVVAIALGVALGFAVQLINHTALAEFAAGLATLSGDADLQVQGGRSGFDERVYAELARDPAVSVASPVLQIDAALPGRERSLPVLGIDALRAAAVTPALIGDAADGTDLLRPDVVFLSAAASTWLGLHRGDVLVAQRGVDKVELRVGGTVPADPRTVVAVMDVAGAQDAFGRPGVLSRIDLRLRPGVDAKATAQRLAAKLPAGVGVSSPRSTLESTERLTRAYRVNLEVLALVALFTGALLVYSTQSLAVQRRRVPFALLRSLGLTRGRLVRLVTMEGALLGVVGASTGLAAGYAVAAAATRWFGLDLGAGFFRGQAPGVAMDWVAATWFGAAGVAAAALGSYAPARGTARLAPAAALKPGEPADTSPHAQWPGPIALAAGAALAWLPPVQGLPLFGYAAIALLLLGTLHALPGVAHATLMATPVPRAVPAALAIRHLRHAGAETRLSLAAIVAAVSLMSAMTVMVASFRGSLETWLGQVLPADLYLRAGTGGDTGYLPPAVQHALRALPGVERVEFLRANSLLLDAGEPRVVLLAREVDPANPSQRLPLIGAPVTPARDAPPPAWISEAVADRRTWRVGDVVQLPIAGRATPFTIAGVWRDYARQQGSIVITRDTYVRLTGDERVTDAAVWLARGADAGRVRAAVQDVAGADRSEVATPGELRDTSLRIFDRTFAVTYALEAVAVLIGLTGLSSSFGAQVIARRREFGMLRHVGATRRQVGAMLAVEGLALSAVGVVAGVVLGFVIALILIFVVNRQSFHWSMDLLVPWPALGALAIALLLLGTLTAWLTGRRVMDDDVIRAVKDDW